ncbi:hypothetical protein ABK040_006313 [Willaertia magna]
MGQNAQKNYTMEHEFANQHGDETELTNDLTINFDNYNSLTFSKFKFDNSLVPVNIQKLFIYLCTYSKCLSKQRQLKIPEFEDKNLTYNKYKTELQSAWMSLCPSYVLFREKPECLLHLHTDDISGKRFSATERRNLLENDLTKCVHLGDESQVVKNQKFEEGTGPILLFDDNIALKHYYIVANYVKRMNLPGSINKNWEQLVHALKGDYTKSNNMNSNNKEEDLLFNQNEDLSSKESYQKKIKKIRENMKLDKQYKYVLDNYNDLAIIPSLPNFTYYMYSVGAAYCRKHILACMAKEVASSGSSDEEIIEKSSIGTVVRCFSSFEGSILESCVLNVAKEIDDQFVTDQQQQAPTTQSTTQ